jgi:hypothetical protein
MQHRRPRNGAAALYTERIQMDGMAVSRGAFSGALGRYRVSCRAGATTLAPAQADDVLTALAVYLFRQRGGDLRLGRAGGARIPALN